MKRKLLSPEPRKGNQEITKFFKSLISQGAKQGSSNMDNCSRKINDKSADGFRVPILERFQAMKKEESPFQNNTEICSRSDQGVEQGVPIMDVKHDTKYHFGSSTPDDQCEVIKNSRRQNVKSVEKPLNVSLTCKNGMIQGFGSFGSESVEASNSGCNERFFSVCEELDSTYNVEGFEDALDSSPCNSNTMEKIASVGRSSGVKCPSPSIKDLPSGYSVNEVDCKQPSVHENTHISSLNRDSNSFDDNLSDNSNSSDEDLLMPPRFLFFNKLKPDVKTPEKGTAPENASPITPLSTTEEAKGEVNFRYKLSFDKLIADKAKRKEKDAELAKMEAALEHSIQNGGVAQFEPSGLSDLESEEELMDDGRDLKECTLPQDIKKFLVEVRDFSDEVPGEDIFPLFVPVDFSQDVPCLSKVLPPEADTFEEKLASASALDLQELLCGGWILQHYLSNPCSVQVAEWLFEIMCQNHDQHIISSSFQVLWVMLDAATEKRDDLTHASRGGTWLPSLRKVIEQILSFGATLPRLYPGDLVNDLNVRELVSSEWPPQVNGTEEVTLLNSGIKTENFPVVNIMHLVQFITYGLQKCPLSYTVQSLRQLVVLLCRLALDVRLQSVVFDIEMCIAAVLNCFGEAQWPDEVKELCRIMAKVTTNHRNLLHVVQLQPPSPRGIYLQRLLSLTLLYWLVPRFASQESYQQRSVKCPARCDMDVPDSVKVSSLLKLVEKLKPGESSDYFLLHSLITLVNLAVGSEDVAPKERAALERLTNRLRNLNGDIKDPRAAFMDRTKVKDLLVRTIHRLAYMTQCIKPVREITNYFECSTSDYQIELLKETAGQDDIDAAEKDEHGDERMIYEQTASSGEETMLP